jgi:hypothetical protein
MHFVRQQWVWIFREERLWDYRNEHIEELKSVLASEERTIQADHSKRNTEEDAQLERLRESGTQGEIELLQRTIGITRQAKETAACELQEEHRLRIAALAPGPESELYRVQLHEMWTLTRSVRSYKNVDDAGQDFQSLAVPWSRSAASAATSFAGTAGKIGQRTILII